MSIQSTPQNLAKKRVYTERTTTKLTTETQEEVLSSPSSSPDICEESSTDKLYHIIRFFPDKSNEYGVSSEEEAIELYRPVFGIVNENEDSVAEIKKGTIVQLLPSNIDIYDLKKKTFRNGRK
ncbi:hypothetical protein RFI_09122 [Reticulomyxa filosa]|uniref:Uncharacterized protein n=1 Tax=Reticulomyxa filosa TaxID=46433 RepID=X6NQN4_RETFI|nr:hypothetical protein RFI_09122 [Reticulomyxa filosa]|eukprot:ETO28009.1 hypothetical protein RFI_09122 [Reticulomyxa filosa]